MMTLKTNHTAAPGADALPDLDAIRGRRTPACRVTTNPCGQPPGSPGGVSDPHRLVLEHLRAIRADMAAHGQRLGRIELRLSVMEQTLGSLYAVGGSDREAMQILARRVERIERRLDLKD